MTIAYKVCCIKNDKPRSLIGAFLPGEKPQYSLEYGIGVKTKPKIEGSYLMAFDSLGAALTFWNTQNRRSTVPLQIYKARVEKAEPGWKTGAVMGSLGAFQMFQITPGVITKTFREFWNKSTRATANLATPPLGTIFCKSITLLEKV